MINSAIEMVHEVLCDMILRSNRIKAVIEKYVQFNNGNQ